MDRQVTCITKPNAASRHEHITNLGGLGWNWTRAQVITAIENKTDTFYTTAGGTRANVAVVNGPTGKYVRTHADGKWTDNLLALPECS